MGRKADAIIKARMLRIDVDSSWPVVKIEAAIHAIVGKQSKNAPRPREPGMTSHQFYRTHRTGKLWG